MRSPSVKLRKAVDHMEFSNSQIEAIQCRFDWFCKKVMRNKAFDIDIENKKPNNMRGMVISFDIGGVHAAHYDEYSYEKIRYEACGYVVYVKEDQLVNIFNELPEKKRNILILSHLIGLTDEEIAETLQITKKTLSEYKSRLINKCREVASTNG